MKLNANKSQVMTLKQGKSKKMNNRTKLQLFLNGKPLKRVDEITLLGVTFQKNTSFAKHIQNKVDNSVNRINMMRCLRGRNWGASSRTLLYFYKAFVPPVLETGYIVTADAKKTHLNKLQKVQNYALRIALSLPVYTEIAALHILEDCDTIKE